LQLTSWRFHGGFAPKSKSRRRLYRQPSFHAMIVAESFTSLHSRVRKPLNPKRVITLKFSRPKSSVKLIAPPSGPYFMTSQEQIVEQAVVVCLGYRCAVCAARVAVLRSTDPATESLLPDHIVSVCRCGSCRTVRRSKLLETMEVWREPLPESPPTPITQRRRRSLAPLRGATSLI
jgi:hypothetical protein